MTCRYGMPGVSVLHVRLDLVVALEQLVAAERSPQPEFQSISVP